jgi:hypothetical protein
MMLEQMSSHWQEKNNAINNMQNMQNNMQKM